MIIDPISLISNWIMARSSFKDILDVKYQEGNIIHKHNSVLIYTDKSALNFN